VASVLGELAVLLDLHVRPTHTLVTRWDDAFPQYEVGHLIRVGRIDKAMAELGTVAVAGAALRGVGIPACIASGRAAGRRILGALHPAPDPAPDPAAPDLAAS
jgi:oxygen-dependent protoporphyrinogen oxidase